MKQYVDNFSEVTGYDLSELLNLLDIFFTNYSAQLVAYCNGTVNKPPSTALQLLRKLSVEVDNALALYEQYKSSFTTLGDWEVLEAIDEFRTRLDTHANLPKYLRSANVGIGYTTTPSVRSVISADMSPERYLRFRNGTANSDEEWIALTLQQDITEEQYGQDNDDLVVSLPGNRQSGAQLQAVLGYGIGNEALGRDLDKRLSFTEHDLKVLDPQSTLEQSFLILLNLQKEDIPEFPAMGLQNFVGVSKGSVAYKMQTIMRQLNQTFDTDDTFVGVEVSSVDTLSDAISIQVSATPVASTLQAKELPL
jgi:hypothetical protein